MNSCKSFNTFCKTKNDYNTVLEVINALISISSFEEGYYHYSYTTVQGEYFIETCVKFQEYKGGFKFLINSKNGFIITPSNSKKNFMKLINISPVLVLYQYARDNFNSSPVPVNSFDFINAIYESTNGSINTSNGSMHFSKSFPCEYQFEIKTERTNSLINYAAYDSGIGYYQEVSAAGGVIKITGNYNLSMFQIMSSIFNFMCETGYISDEIILLAPCGYVDTIS